MHQALDLGLLENLDPHRGIAGGYAGGVAQPSAGEITPGRIFLSEKTAERRGECLGQMADVRDNLVVAFRGDGGNLRAQRTPELGDGFNGRCRRGGEGSDETGASFEKCFSAVFPTGLLTAGHRMRTDERGVGRHGCGAKPAEFVLHAADISHDCAGLEMGCDLAGKLDDLFNGCSEHDQIGAAHGRFGGIGNLVTPRLRAQLLSDFRAPGPDDDLFGQSTGVGGFGDRATKQARGENRQLVKHRNGKRERRTNVEFFGVLCAGESGSEFSLSAAPPWPALATDERYR